MLPTMDGKETSTNNPVVVIQPSQDTKKMSSTKKYVIIGVISIILLGLLLTGIMVGMHIFTQAQKDLVEFTFKLRDGYNQDVTSDVTNNVVKYHVKDDDQESWIVSDFNKDIKTTKIHKNGRSDCYLAPLNRSDAILPSEITKPDKNDAIFEPKGYRPVVYQVVQDPIADNSFLSKDARNMCNGVSTYWLYPSCSTKMIDSPSNTTMRGKRQQPTCVAIRWIWNNGLQIPCVCGCQVEVCACRVDYTCRWDVNGIKHCTFNYWACPNGYYRIYYGANCY